MALGSHHIAAAGRLAAVFTLAACTGPFDADLRSIGRGFDTTNDVVGARGGRPPADARGVIAYDSYEVALARRGDTAAQVASRVGVPAADLARFNGIAVDAPLRDGELLVLPGGTGGTSGSGGGFGGGFRGGSGGGAAGGSASGPVDVAAVAGAALDRAGPSSAASGGVQTTTLSPPTGREPGRHRVQPGETAFSIAQRYQTTPAALADLNGLGADFGLREGQVLLIPGGGGSVAAAGTTVAAARPQEVVTRPGAGSPTPVPPSAARPLPSNDPAPGPLPAPAPPAMADARTDSARLGMPASGGVIRAYRKGQNEGIDIAAGAGSPVRAAEAGTVAAITRDTDQVPIIVIRHEDNLLTVYAGVDRVGVEKGDRVTRGQEIAKVRAGSPPFLHFEVRDGFESVDPMDYLN